MKTEAQASFVTVRPHAVECVPFYVQRHINNSPIGQVLRLNGRVKDHHVV